MDSNSQPVMIGIEEALNILASRGIAMDNIWLRKKARDGGIPGAQKVGGEHGIWLIPKEWAETYIKSKRGRPRK